MKNQKEKILNRFVSVFLGEVKAIDDPLKMGRVRVRVFGLHSEDLLVSKLPWFLPVAPITAGMINKQSDSGIPQIGSICTIQFINGDISQGIYTGIIPDATDFANPEEYQTGQRVIVTKTGHTILIDEEKISITQDDTLTKVELTSGTINVFAEKDVNVTAKGSITLSAKQIILKDLKYLGNLIINSTKFLNYFSSHRHFSSTGPTSGVTPDNGFALNSDWHSDSITVEKRE